MRNRQRLGEKPEPPASVPLRGLAYAPSVPGARPSRIFVPVTLSLSDAPREKRKASDSEWLARRQQDSVLQNPDFLILYARQGGAVTAGSTTVGDVAGVQSRLRSKAWVDNLPFLIVFTSFGIYATWRALENKFFWTPPYLTPFYSPLIDPEHHWWPFSPALIILGAPLGFRLTCYYYRKAYYRAYFADPPGCAVREGRSKYSGETSFPFILQNIHRYFFYLAVVFIVILWYDAIKAFFFPNGFGIGVGTLVMLANVILLTTYTFSCHSLRHLVGGKLDCFSCATFGAPRYSAWSVVTKLNERHMLWAWASMISVGLTDLYIRLVASGTIRDIRLL
jgi:hypothetical protein